MKLLLVTPGQSRNPDLALALINHDYQVSIASDSKTGLGLANTDCYDIVLFDASGSSVDAVAFCQTLRSYACQTPVLLLVADDSRDLRIASLDAGADDYLVTPFSQAELLLRIQALLRRGQFMPNSCTHSDSKKAELILSKFWDQFKPSFLSKLITLEQAAQAALSQELSLELHEQALQDAHRLAGALGIFGYMAGSEIARDIEYRLERNLTTESGDILTLDQQVRSLKNLLQHPPNDMPPNVNVIP